MGGWVALVKCAYHFREIFSYDLMVFLFFPKAMGSAK